jgi:glycosyltransferase involved in cell wall biosynthesis
MHNSCDVNLAPSTPVMTELGRHGFRRLRLWARGVDGALFHPSRRSTDVRRALGAQGDEPLLLYVGRLAKEKQIDDLRPVLQQFSSARLAIVGDGPERGPLEAAFSGLRVTFTGTLRGIQLAEAYASADVFCFPSPSETFGNVVLEAMASGLPVVAPASGGVLDLVRPGVTGALYAPGDLQDLVQAVAPLLHPEGPSRRYGAAGRAEAEQRTWRAQVQRLLWHYRAVLRLHRVSRRVLIPNEVAMS